MLLGLSITSCEDFLDRPAEDSYNDSNYYQNDEQCKAGVLSLYNVPWYDFLSRGFYKIPEVMAATFIWEVVPTCHLTLTEVIRI